MSGPAVQTTPPPTAEPPPFKRRYKLHGTIGALVLMWLAFAYIYNGLTTGDAGAVSTGMVVMLGAAGAAYYFG